MYSTVPPRIGDAGRPGEGWGLRRAVRLAFPGPAELAGDTVHAGRLDVYLTDLLGQYEHKLERGALERDAEPGGQSYGEMAEALIKLAVPDGESVDLLILAYAIPDITPGRATATYLTHVCPGKPMAFAVSDQGAAAGFTGLRLIRDYAGTGGPRRALLLVVEQAELPYDLGVPVAVPTGHSGVALLFGDLTETSDTPGSPGSPGSPDRARLDSVIDSVSVYPGLEGAALADQVGALFAGTAGSPDTGGATAILSAEFATRVPAPTGPSQVRIAAAGQPYTGVWWELAGALAEAGTCGSRILLADYAPESQYLCFAAIDMAGGHR